MVLPPLGRLQTSFATETRLGIVCLIVFQKMSQPADTFQTPLASERHHYFEKSGCDPLPCQPYPQRIDERACLNTCFSGKVAHMPLRGFEGENRIAFVALEQRRNQYAELRVAQKPGSRFGVVVEP